MHDILAEKDAEVDSLKAQLRALGRRTADGAAAAGAGGAAASSGFSHRRTASAAAPGAVAPHGAHAPAAAAAAGGGLHLDAAGGLGSATDGGAATGGSGDTSASASRRSTGGAPPTPANAAPSAAHPHPQLHALPPSYASAAGYPAPSDGSGSSGGNLGEIQPAPLPATAGGSADASFGGGGGGGVVSSAAGVSRRSTGMALPLSTVHAPEPESDAVSTAGSEILFACGALLAISG